MDTQPQPLVLLIDDDPALLMGLSAMIKKHGYRVVEAEDGNEGLKKAKEVLPDLILSDVIGNRLEAIQFVLALSLGLAGASVLGQSLGAGRPERAAEVLSRLHDRGRIESGVAHGRGQP